MKHFVPAAFLLGLLIAPGAGQSAGQAVRSQRATEYIANSDAGVKALQSWYAEERVFGQPPTGGTPPTASRCWRSTRN